MYTANVSLVNLARYIASVQHAEQLAQQWKMSTAERQALTVIVQLSGQNLAVDELKRLVVFNQITVQDGINVLFSEDRSTEVQEFARWEPPVFPINGQIVMDVFGLQPGPEVGKRLSALKVQWADAGYPEVFDIKGK